jgi:hypothetical protein
MPDRSRSSSAVDAAFVDRVAAPLRAAERVDSTFGERVMSAVRADVRERTAAARGTPTLQPRGWWRRSWTLRLTPVTALAAAAAIAVLALLGVRAGIAHRDRSSALASAPTDTVYVVRFVLVAPDARNVSIVGDFNHWNRATTALAPSGNDGVWTASVALPPGRHEYAFIVDGEHWMPDPLASVTIHDDFGTASSIVTVGSRES